MSEFASRGPIERAELTIRLNTGRPVEVSDLGRSLQALGKQFEEFVVAHGYDHAPGNAQLFVTHLETGSIIATLQTMLDQASFVLEHLDVLAPLCHRHHHMVHEGGWTLTLDRQRQATFLPPIARANPPPAAATG